jgi:hypothetical protein
MLPGRLSPAVPGQAHKITVEKKKEDFLLSGVPPEFGKVESVDWGEGFRGKVMW